MSTKKYGKFSLFEVIGTVLSDNEMVKKHRNLLYLMVNAWHVVCKPLSLKSIKACGALAGRIADIIEANQTRRQYR